VWLYYGPPDGKSSPVASGLFIGARLV
jgi:hypothetical protein